MMNTSGPYQIGDRVECIKDFPDGNQNIIQGSEGVVCDMSLSRIGVCWDEPVEGHDCEGRCAYGHGWYVYEDDVRTAVVDTTEIDDASFLIMIGVTK